MYIYLYIYIHTYICFDPDSKVHGANMGPRWAPCWPYELCYQGMFPKLNSAQRELMHYTGTLMVWDNALVFICRLRYGDGIWSRQIVEGTQYIAKHQHAHITPETEMPLFWRNADHCIGRWQNYNFEPSQSLKLSLKWRYFRLNDAMVNLHRSYRLSHMHTLTQKCCHFDEIFVTSCTGSDTEMECQKKSRHSFISVYTPIYIYIYIYIHIYANKQTSMVKDPCF